MPAATSSTACCALRGFQTLAIDCDPQGNLTTSWVEADLYEDVERASEAKERVLCDYSAEPMEIGFNSTYLQEVLQNVDGEDTVFEFSSPNRAGVVHPAEAADGEDLLMLIMPVMLNTYA